MSELLYVDLDPIFSNHFLKIFSPFKQLSESLADSQFLNITELELERR